MSGSYISGTGRRQLLLLPDMIENYIEEDNEKETEHVGRGTPEFTPVEIGSIPERANPVVETGSPRSSDVGGCHLP